MKLSPLDIYNHEFNKSTFGYNVKQVDEFLDDVGMAYEKILKDINKVQDENERLKEKLGEYENMEERMEKLMLTIQETAKEQTKQAQKQAEYIIKKAEIKAEKMKMQAKNQIKEEYEAYQDLREAKDLFKIRFKTMLESHLQMLEEKTDEDFEFPVEEDIAAGKLDLDE